MAEGTQRRLAAIVSADVVGYSRLMGVDETGTLAALRAHRAEMIDGKITEHGGRIVKTMGDGLLLVFANAVDAVRCSIDVQEEMTARNLDVRDDEKIIFRIGINLSEIIFEDGDIFGDGVNVTARLEGMAEPGGLLISHAVQENIVGNLGAVFADNGERALKNIANPVRVWSWPRKLPTNRPDRKPFVVVAEFEGRGEEEKALAGDLRDDLAAALSRLTGLEVTLDQRKADYLIQGGIRLTANRCRLSAQLISVDNEKQLWAERYQEDAADTFEILDRCVPRMVMSVRRRIALDDAERLSEMSLEEMTIEQLLSASGVSFFTPTKDGWLRGGKIAERALQREPKNFMALAMAATGGGMTEILYGFRTPDDKAITLALKRIEEGRRQTNTSDMLLSVYSFLLLFGRNQHEEAIAAAEASLQLNPEFNLGLWSLGAAKIFAGDFEAGVDAATRAVNVDIRDPYVHLYSRVVGYGHFSMKRFQDAVDWFWKADQLAPALPHNLAGLAASRSLNKDHKGAHGAVARLLDEEPEFRIRDMMALPFRDISVGEWFIDGLHAAGAPD